MVRLPKGYDIEALEWPKWLTESEVVRNPNGKCQDKMAWMTMMMFEKSLRGRLNDVGYHWAPSEELTYPLPGPF